jgi:hypothetical protein
MMHRKRWEAMFEQHEMSEAAKKWRTLWRRVRWLAFGLLGGAAAMGGEQALKWILHRL